MIQERQLAYISMSVAEMSTIYPEMHVPVLAIGGPGLTADVLPYYSAVHTHIQLPDDIHIVALHYHASMKAWYLVITGSGLPRRRKHTSMPHYQVEYRQDNVHHITVTRMVCTCE